MRLISHPAWRHGPSALVCPLVLPRVSLASLKVQWGHPCAVPDEAMLHQWMQWLCGRGPAGILSAPSLAAADFTSAEYNGESYAVRMFSAGAQYDF